MDEKTWENIKKILYNYNLLDDYYIADDTSTSTGEIYTEPLDASITLNTKANKDIAKQLALLQTAVDKIYKGYLAAFNKDAYKKQFDLYPLRDFEEHMASLGAQRSGNGKDFEPADNAEEIDWIARTKKELDARVSEYKKKEQERKEQEIIDKEDKKIKEHNENVKKFDGMRKIPRYTGTKESKKGTPWIDPSVNLPPVEQSQRVDENEFNVETSMQDEINRQKGLQQRGEGPEGAPEYGQTGETPHERSSKDAEEKVKVIKKKVKGQVIEEERQKKLMSALTFNKQDKMALELSGFKTKGPFCLQKRKYFKDIFRPSISHYDTEFREAEITRKPAKDESETKDIEKVEYKPGTAPFSVDDLGTDVPSVLSEESQGKLNDLGVKIGDLYDFLKNTWLKYRVNSGLPDETVNKFNRYFAEIDKTKFIYYGKYIILGDESGYIKPHERDLIDKIVPEILGALKGKPEYDIFIQKVTDINNFANQVSNEVKAELFTKKLKEMFG